MSEKRLDFRFVVQEPGEGEMMSPRSVLGLTWQLLTLSPACAVVSATSSANTDIDEATDTAVLRDSLSDLSDDLAGFGLRLPLVLVVECPDDKTYRHWHRRAGDQDWHRGAFGIQAYLVELFRPAGIENLEQLVAMLANPASIGATEYQLREITAEDYAARLRHQLDDLGTSPAWAKGYDLELYQTLIASLLPEITANGSPQAGIERWLEHVVTDKARRLSAPETETGAETS